MIRPTRYTAGGAVHDVVVVGGGAAGLSAALVLGRAGRCTVVMDAGHPRNEPSRESHGIFTRDGTPPLELLRIARSQLAAYPSVEVRGVAALSAQREAEGFVLRGSDGLDVRARVILLAVGVRDELPQTPGMAPLWGNGVLHCPYCHAWEVRDEPLAVRASGQTALGLVTLLLGWTRDLMLCSDGPADLSAQERAELESRGVQIVETPIRRIDAAFPGVRLEFTDGKVERRRALFIRPSWSLSSDLPDLLACERTETGLIRVGSDHQTSATGVYAAGDVTTAQRQVLIAAAAGAEAAMQIIQRLAREDFDKGPGSRCLMDHPPQPLQRLTQGRPGFKAAKPDPGRSPVERSPRA